MSNKFYSFPKSVFEHYHAKIKNWVRAVLPTKTSDLTNDSDFLDQLALAGIVASTFSTSSTYEVGDYVLYNHTLYRCKTAISAAGAWDSSKWDATKTQDIFRGSAPGLVPAAENGDADKVLKGDGTWAEAGSVLPDPTESDSLLLGQSDGSKAWNALSRDVMGTSLLDESNRPILDENSNPVYDANSTTDLWTSFAGHEFGARRAYADQEGNNIKATYARKEVLDDLASALDTINDTLESVSHGGMYDLGDKTEADLINGKLAIGCGNSTTTLTLTTVNAVTILANSGVPNFALLIDNSGNSNAVTVTVKDSTDTTTFLQSVSAGNEVAAGKIYQLTCVGKCWTLAEFGTANA